MLLLIITLAHPTSARVVESVRKPTVDAFAELLKPYLKSDSTELEPRLRQRLSGMIDRASRRTLKTRFTDHFGFWPREDLGQRIDALADDYLRQFDRTFTAREEFKPDVAKQLAATLKTVASAYARSASTAEIIVRPSRSGLIKRYLTEAAVVWGGVMATVGLPAIHAHQLSLIGGGIIAAAALLQNLNFWWATRSAPPAGPPNNELIERAGERRVRFWSYVAEFLGEDVRPKGALDRFVKNQFEQIGALGGETVHEACETWLAGKSKRFK